jgi:hypothetical protein
MKKKRKLHKNADNFFKTSFFSSRARLQQDIKNRNGKMRFQSQCKITLRNDYFRLISQRENKII